jgi:hypothetical protein
MLRALLSERFTLFEKGCRDGKGRSTPSRKSPWGEYRDD